MSVWEKGSIYEPKTGECGCLVICQSKANCRLPRINAEERTAADKEPTGMGMALGRTGVNNYVTW